MTYRLISVPFLLSSFRKKNRFLIFIFLTVSYVSASSQILSKDSFNSLKSDSLIQEKLVQLALNSPFYKSAESQNKINEYQLKAAKNAWLNLLALSVNYNEQSFAKTTGPSTYVYPKYFFGFNIPLGTLFSKTPVKAAQEQVTMSKNNEEQLARTIRAEVLSKYQQYKAYSNLIVLQSQVVDDYQAGFVQAEKKFRDGSITIELYNAASKNYNEEMSKKINLQLEQDLVRIDIERMIGTDLKNVIQ